MSDYKAITDIIDRHALLNQGDTYVIKAGSSVIEKDGRLNGGKIMQISGDISRLAASGKKAVYISSGAILAELTEQGISKKEFKERFYRSDRTFDNDAYVFESQLLSGSGQIALMNTYKEEFGKHGRKIAQVLLTERDFMCLDTLFSEYINSIDAGSEKRQSIQEFLHAPGVRSLLDDSTYKKTIAGYLERGIVPIINENDALRNKEIKFGDNDGLAALVATGLNASYKVAGMILLSENELHDKDPHIHEDAEKIDVVCEQAGNGIIRPDGAFCRLSDIENNGTWGTGGMTSKLEAARICCESGIPVVLINYKNGDSSICDVVEGKEAGTLFLPKGCTKIN